MNNKTWRSKACLYSGIIAIILMPLAALGSKYGLWDFRMGFNLLLTAVILALIGLGIALVYFPRKVYTGDRPSLIGGGSISLLPIVIAVSVVSQGGGPMIHDISTDLQNPPSFEAALSQRGEDSNPVQRAADVGEQQAAGYPDIKTIKTPLNPTQALARADAVALELGWEVLAGQRPNHIEAVDTTFWFGFKDDIVIRVLPDEQGSLVDLRSISRVGKGDMGANAARVATFSEMF
ncbi:MAG: DUF1499 domain-containing protein [Pseudomonadales bacterium]